MKNANLIKASEYIFNNGLLYKFGTGANSISTESCLIQERYVKETFNLSSADFSEAWKMAELLDRQEAEAETAFFKSHPELNP